MKLLRAVIALSAALFLSATAHAGDVAHKLAIHVDQDDPAVMALALNNVENVKAFYAAKGEGLTVEVVAYGPGLNMLLAAKSPVRERIAAMSLEDPTMQFSACGNTLAKMQEKAGKELPLLSEARVVTSGVVRLIELQEQGYAYVKP